MNLTDRRLVREIVIVIIIKLMLITALWWLFVRDSKVAVDPAAMATQIAAPQKIISPHPQPSTTGESHVQ